MKRVLQLVMLVACIASFAAVANAQASRTWVSGVGDDANPCSRTAPCKTFAGSISKTAANGVINCLDPGGFGGVTITKSITIDCHDIYAGILNASTNGTLIAFDSFGADVRKTVRLRNLNYDGFSTGLNGIRIIGGTTVAGGTVIIEDCMIDNNFGAPGHGIADNRTNGGELIIKNTSIRDNGGSAVSVVPTSGSVRLNVTVDNCYLSNNNFGVAVGNGVRAQVTNTVATGNTSAGYLAEGPLAASELNVSNSVSTNNGTGVRQSNTAVVRLYNNDISFNATGFTGATTSYGLNRISSNTVAGPAPTAIGAASGATGTQ